MKNIQVHPCDVLVVGSGLAGLRAGISALSDKSGVKVCLVTGMKGPSGSSFTNRNNALGMIVCHSDSEKETFFNTAMNISQPGIIHPELVHILAEESDFHFHELVSTGLHFSKMENGVWVRIPGCFMKISDQAYVFTDIVDAFNALKHRFINMGGELIDGYYLVEVVTGDGDRISGAVFMDDQNESSLAVSAKAIVLSTGGTAGLFKRNITGRGLSGFTYGLINRLGVRFVNTGFFQFLWYDTLTMEHWPCWSISSPGVRIKGKRGEMIPVPEFLHDLCIPRAHHIPLYHGGEDSAIDRFLVDESNPDRTLDVFDQQSSMKRVALFAHASNGGILIDGQASTSVPGLFACGECAGGMHGANRVGGAMVLATQVFGHRAGKSASKYAQSFRGESANPFKKQAEVSMASLFFDPGEWADGLNRLKHDLGKTVGPVPGSEQTDLLMKYRTILETVRDWRLKKTIETALIILENNS